MLAADRDTTMSVHLSYDPVTDAAYLPFSAQAIVESEEVAPGLVLDYDADGRMVGMEVLQARAHLRNRCEHPTFSRVF